MSSVIINPYAMASGGGGGSTLLTDLVAWWDMSSASGNEPDQHGAFDLTDNGGVGYSASGGPGGKKARTFDGTDDYLSVACSGSLQSNLNNLTWAGWWRPDTLDDFDCIGNFHSSLSPQIRLADEGANVMRLWEPVTFNSGSFSTGNWYCYVLRFDVAVGWDVIWNGVKYSSTTKTVAGSSTAFELGAYVVGFRVFQFIGKMGPTAFASRTWDDTEAAEFYNSGNALTYINL